MCDVCDTAMENAEIRENQEDIIETQKQVILALDAQTEHLDE